MKKFTPAFIIATVTTLVLLGSGCSSTTTAGFSPGASSLAAPAMAYDNNPVVRYAGIPEMRETVAAPALPAKP